jgi:hypothetical protein
MAVHMLKPHTPHTRKHTSSMFVPTLKLVERHFHQQVAAASQQRRPAPTQLQQQAGAQCTPDASGSPQTQCAAGRRSQLSIGDQGRIDPTHNQGRTLHPYVQADNQSLGLCTNTSQTRKQINHWGHHLRKGRLVLHEPSQRRPPAALCTLGCCGCTDTSAGQSQNRPCRAHNNPTSDQGLAHTRARKTQNGLLLRRHHHQPHTHCTLLAVTVTVDASKTTHYASRRVQNSTALLVLQVGKTPHYFVARQHRPGPAGSQMQTRTHIICIAASTATGVLPAGRIIGSDPVLLLLLAAGQDRGVPGLTSPHLAAMMC